MIRDLVVLVLLCHQWRSGGVRVGNQRLFGAPAARKKVKLEAANVHALLADLVRFDFGEGLGSGLILSSWTALTVFHVLGDHVGIRPGKKQIGVWQTLSKNVKAILGVQTAVAKQFKVSSVCVVDWFQTVHDGVVAVCTDDSTFKVVGKASRLRTGYER